MEDRAQAAEWTGLGASYVRLAEAAAKNTAADIAVEFGRPPKLKGDE